MENCIISLTVYFDNPFWVGVLESRAAKGLVAARIVFGPEPSDAEVYAWLNSQWHAIEFSGVMKAELKDSSKINPKRMQRKISAEMAKVGVTTKAQEALSWQREQTKCERASKSRAEKERKKELSFEMKRQKRREKHRGH